MKLRGGFLGVVSGALRVGDGTSVLDRDISAFGCGTLRALVPWESLVADCESAVMFAELVMVPWTWGHSSLRIGPGICGLGALLRSPKNRQSTFFRFPLRMSFITVEPPSLY